MEQPNPDRASIQAELLELSRKVEKITVPLSYADELYALRSHIHWVLKKLEQQGRGDSAAHGTDAENTDHLANSHA